CPLETNVSQKPFVLSITPHFSLGASFASELAYRTLLLNEQSDLYRWIIDGRNDHEIPRFGYSATLSMTYEFNRHWSVGIGVGYSKKGYRTNIVDIEPLTFGDVIDPITGNVHYSSNDPAIPQKLRNVYGFAYITIPVQLSYVAGKGKIRSISSIGMSVDMLNHATSVFVGKYSDRGWERKTTDQTEQFSQWNLTPMVSTGIAMQVGTRLRFTLAPVARYGL
ncbi:MAG TPA: outer membrane beta-barrel protein, partial [Flavobacteriales bacterium]|nr:outer membrane beta-barrel protein [Flavobacteriales bacterium]HQZ93283.1 outer membrane beta-barrel protein [Flavobacteriales bacterium]